MKLAIITASLFYLIASVPLFFASPRLFFALTIPARALANLLVGVDIVGVGGLSISFADLLGTLTLIFGFAYCIGKYQKILASRSIKLAIFFMLLFVFLTGAAALASGPHKLIEAAKVVSWLIYFPLGYLLFPDSNGISMLKKAGVAAALMTLAAFAAGNALKVGETAYDLGMIYLGFFTSEAALATALTGGLLFFFLPNPPSKSSRFIVAISWMLIIVLVLMIVVVLVRSIILGIFFFFLVYSFMRHADGLARRSAALLGVVILLTILVAGVILTNPQNIGGRFKDVQEYRKEGGVAKLGSGRISLIILYFEEYRSQSALAQIFGIDFYSRTGQTATKTLNDKQFGTHNDALQILFLSGLVGLILYAAMWLSMALAIKRALGSSLDPYRRNVAALGAGLVGMYAVLIFHGAIFHVLLLQTIMVVLGASLGLNDSLTPGSDLVC